MNEYHTELMENSKEIIDLGKYTHIDKEIKKFEMEGGGGGIYFTIFIIFIII